MHEYIINKKIFFPEVSFKRKEEYSKKIAPLSVKNDTKIYNKNIEVNFTVEITNDDASVTIFLHCVGLFQLDKAQLPISIEDFANKEAPSIMYIHVREYVAELTQKAGLDPLVLPDVNFADINTKKKKQKKKDKN